MKRIRYHRKKPSAGYRQSVLWKAHIKGNKVVARKNVYFNILCYATHLHAREFLKKRFSKCRKQ